MILADYQFDVIDSTKDWLAYAILLLQAIAFVFFVFMLFTKIVEGLIRLVGGVHFDESTHPLDGGLFAAIMDLDCLNGVRGGKAAARRRRKRGSKQLQRNVSAAGSLTTQMMLDRHSQGVARLPMSEGQTPFLTTYPKNVEEDHFPVLQPPLGPPPPERHSWESRSDEPSTGHIMDAWHPPATAAGYAAPGGYVPSGSTPTGANEPDNAPKRSFSVVRGGQADYRDPYTVKDRAYMAQALAAPSPRMSQAGQRSTTPKHARHQSSSALVEVVDGVPLTSPSNTSLVNAPGLRLNNEGVRPPALAIPKRRSLNTLKDERGASPDSPDSKYSHSAKAKKGKRSSKPSAWFSKALVESEESDDEPGPSRRKGRRTSRGPIPFEPVPMSPEEPKKGWRSAIGLGRKKSLDAIAEQARDENKARKASLAAQSGALFAGVEAPTPSPAKKAFVVNRKSSVPTAAPIAEYGGGSTSPSSFRVKRLAQPSPAPIPTPLAPPASSTPPVTTAAAPQSPVRSFQVIRPQVQSPTMGSFAVSRPVVHHAPFPPIPDADIGYAPSSFVPLSETRSTSSSAEPTRPPRDPRRPSQESGRGYAL